MLVGLLPSGKKCENNKCNREITITTLGPVTIGVEHFLTREYVTVVPIISWIIFNCEMTCLMRVLSSYF